MLEQVTANAICNLIFKASLFPSFSHQGSQTTDLFRCLLQDVVCKHYLWWYQLSTRQKLLNSCGSQTRLEHIYQGLSIRGRKSISPRSSSDPQQAFFKPSFFCVCLINHRGRKGGRGNTPESSRNDSAVTQLNYYLQGSCCETQPEKHPRFQTSWKAAGSGMAKSWLCHFKLAEQPQKGLFVNKDSPVWRKSSVVTQGIEIHTVIEAVGSPGWCCSSSALSSAQPVWAQANP